MISYLTKKDFIWLIWTILLCLFVSIIQMFSRDITLDKVHRTEFALLYRFFNESSFDRHHLQSTLEPLLTERKFALFQVAIISEDSCFENTQHYYNNPLLCSTFQDFKNLMPYMSLTEFKTSDIAQEKTSSSYLIKKFSDSDEYLIAKTNFYSKDNELSQFLYFIANRYYQTNGYYKIYEKGKFLFTMIFLTSFILWVLNKLQYKKYRDRYSAYIKKEEDLQSRMLDIEAKYNDIKNKKYENELMLEEAELKIKNLDFQSDAQKKELESAISALTNSKSELESLLQEDENLIEKLEREAVELRKNTHLQLNKLEPFEQKEKNELIYKKLENLEKLWRHEPTWKDRKNIESLVSLKDAHLPFTITQGFIAFDKLVLNLAKQHDAYLVESQTNLINNINIIFNNGLLPLKYEQNFHDIRKARNKWFHAGIYPTLETIDFLIDVLQDTDAEVFI
ncbi:MAG: hypothetical protein KGZ62_03925 [Sulfurimonas sp.]|nr:hypothetical protein [Sulfurimonas sp.]